MIEYTPQLMDTLGKLRMIDLHKDAAKKRMIKQAKRGSAEANPKGKGLLHAILSLLP